MNVIVDVCVVPVGVGVSVSEYVAECERILLDAGFDPILHPYGTVVEGDWNEVFEAVRRCHERVHEMGAPRISTSMRIGTRTDRPQTAAAKVESVERLLDED